MKRWMKYLLVASLNGNVVWVISWWLSRPDTVPTHHPFDVNFQVTEKSLFENGYSIFPVDVPNAGLTRGDTTILYFFAYDCRPAIPLIEEGEMTCTSIDVASRSYTIKLNKVDKEAIEKFIEANDGVIKFTWKDVKDRFWVQHKFNGVLFHCGIDSVGDGKYTFNIYNDFPQVYRKKVLKWKQESSENEELSILEQNK